MGGRVTKSTISGGELVIDLKKLEVFLDAAESLSFSEAARHLHFTQPAVSHDIKALEQDLGVELFQRSGAGIQLTEAGRLLIPWAKKLMRDSIALQDMMASLQESVVGDLRIACSTTTGRYILPLLAARFHSRHPGVKVTILVCALEGVVPRLKEGEVNLGVISREAGGDELERQEFFTDHIILIAPADHPWAFGQAVKPADLTETPFIMREANSGTRQVMLTELGKYDISLDDLDIFLEIGNAEAIVETVAGGYGVSFVSRTAAAYALQQGRVAEVPVAGMDLRRKIYMVRRSLDVPNRALEVFWGFIHDPANADLLGLAER
jgi:DNA-binding transcriptional LysR family regulator